ncbi:leucine--tRNA ligase [Aureispira sp. CCB-E]|uniref:leucine--tRNA ligase n=1 Tax=Aureispira sp. CCB-E TaxID=3051121 RepID=UPI002868EF97|nr:leucine--tRNA ligase [Aureispira sp. CCB-E]WMX17334.1 leucine--tRNA ligase [Aureispira sp. CCB-E]
MDYESSEIEAKWKQYWAEHEVYKTSNDTSKPKYYVLDMFPYPSGAGLHVGHPLGYIASDIFARYKRLQGYNVLHPMGYDAFGLPAEQYAIQTGVHPAVSTNQNISFYRKQLDNLGFSFDWSRSVNTSDPKYYKWTQHIFLKLFAHYYNNEIDKAEPIENLVELFEKEGNKNVQAASSQETIFSADEWNGYSPKEQDDVLMNYRLAYRKVGFVNWCEELGTVLANDEVKDGVSERGGYPVVKKPMRQWALRITAYAERLLNGLEQVEFSEALKTQQRNWIGRSEGAQLFFDVHNSNEKIEVFTTRPDTIFGATFMVLAPEHDLVKEITTEAQRQEIEDYQAYANSRSERDRMADVKSITGAFTGAYAVNPFTGNRIPIWIADYVLIGYGTGAIMAVPSGDERDERFAKHFGLEIVQVVDQSAYEGAAIGDKVGTMINSGFLNGFPVTEAITKAIEEINAKNIGEGKINYRLRDANFSRQRYWGEPFPVKYDKDGVAHAETNLPLELPTLDNFKPTKEGKAPLARAEEWVHQDGMTREIDTMPGFAGSSWYFLRYMDPNNDEAPFSAEAVNYWKEVDLYVGGAEHAVGHLMYSRFWHKFMFDLGMVPTREPYKKLVNQGMLQGVIEFLYMLKEKQDGQSVFVSADQLSEYDGQEFAQIPVHIDFVTDYGKPESYLNEEGRKQFKAWRPDYAGAVFVTNAKGQVVTHSEIGKISKRYFNVVNPDDVVAQYGTDCFRMYEMFLGPLEDSKPWDTKGITGVSKFLRKFWNLFYKDGQWAISEEKATPDELKILHTAIKKVNQDIANFSFNTCIAHFMVATNDLKKVNCNKREVLEPLVVLMAPFAPFITEELWQQLGHEGSVHANGKYPEHNPAYLVQSTITYPVCVNGKKRATVTFAADATKDAIEQEALAVDEVQKWIDGKPIRKIIVVPKRMVNIVI